MEITSFISPILITMFWDQRAATNTDFVTVEGRDIALPCLAFNVTANHSVTLIRWFRNRMPKPIYTLDSRKIDFFQSKHFPDPEMDGRAFFDIMSHPSPHLRIDPVRADDSGNYTCSVEFRQKRSEDSFVHLLVVVPPTDVFVLDKYQRQIKGLIGPYDEGEGLKLICESKGGIPTPTVVWVKKYSFGSEHGISRASEGSSELNIPVLKRTDLLAQLFCVAQNSNLTSPRKVAITIDINLRILELRILMSSEMLAGQVIQSVCECIGSRPRPRITWIKDGKSSTGFETFSDDGNITLSRLTWIAVPDDDDKDLTCIGVNPTFPNDIHHTKVKIKVQYKPQLSLQLKDQNSTSLTEGNDIVLICLIKANPKSKHILWHFNDDVIQPNSSKVVLATNTILHIASPDKRHSGNYKCSASNIHGQSVSNSIPITIMYLPVCRNKEHQTYRIGRGERLNLTCDVDAEPEAATFRWSIWAPMRSGPQRSWMTNRPYSLVQLVPDAEVLGATLMCWGVNIVGVQKEPCNFELVKIGAPERLRNCHIINQTAQSAAVMCDAGFAGGEPQVFHVEVYDAESMVLVENKTSAERPFFLVKDLGESFNLLLLFYSSNSQGRSEWTSLRLTKKIASSERSVYATDNQKEKLGPFLSAVIGIFVGITLLIGLCILGLYVIRWKYSKKSSKNKERKGSAKRHSTTSHPEKENRDSSKQTTAKTQTFSRGELQQGVVDPSLAEVKHLNQSYLTETDPDTETPLISK